MVVSNGRRICLSSASAPVAAGTMIWIKAIAAAPAVRTRTNRDELRQRAGATSLRRG